MMNSSKQSSCEPTSTSLEDSNKETDKVLRKLSFDVMAGWEPLNMLIFLVPNYLR
jgi:hypothetical protein